MDVFMCVFLPVVPADDEVTEAPAPPNDSKLYMPMLPKALPALPLPNAAARRGHRKRADDLPHIEKRGMVCDCCFNKCLPSVLARYC